MNKPSYTPGPWKFERLSLYTEHAEITGKPLADHEGYYRENDGTWIVACEGGRIAGVAFKGKAKRGQGYTTPDPEGQANARLIAAAPKLYEELFRALSVIRSPQSYEIEQVCSDIERVLGEAVQR